MNNWPKENSFVYYVDIHPKTKAINVVKLKLIKLWVDKQSYNEPHKMATCRVKEILYGSGFKKQQQIIIDYPHQLSKTRQDVVERILNR